VTFFPSYLTHFLYDNYQAVCNDEKFQKEFDSLTSEFEASRNIDSLAYYPLFLFRRCLFAAVLTLLEKFPPLQIFSILGLSIAMLFYLIVNKPFKDKYTLFMNCFSEGMLIIVTGMLGIFAFDIPQNIADAFGWVTIGTLGMTILGSWVVIGIQQYQLLKERFFNKNNKIKAMKNTEETGENQQTTAKLNHVTERNMPVKTTRPNNNKHEVLPKMKRNNSATHEIIKVASKTKKH